MFENIILMAPDESREPITKQLLFLNPALQVIPVMTLDALVTLPRPVLANGRLIAFTSPIVVPADILAALGHGAYNFHPAPPSYPGLAPAMFAIYRGARIYGATAHLMADKVDSGPIVGVELFLIAEGASVFDIEMQAFTLLARIFNSLGGHLAKNPEPLPTLPITWSSDKSSRRSLAAICNIPVDIARDELDLRVRAFANNHFGVQPTITLHGRRFRLADEPLPASVVAPAPVSVPA